MGLVVSALLALSSAEPTLPAQATHYGRLAEGFVRSRFIRKGMTRDELQRVMGHAPSGGFGGVICSTFYTPYGVGVIWEWRDDLNDHRVGEGPYWFAE